MDDRLAGEIFDLMEKFAGYAFNKSHSATYALVSYQTAWLKANHPAEFMAATLSADMQNTDKVVTLIDEVRRMELPFQPPDVNRGSFRFSVVDGEIIYGLGAIKGVGEGPVQAIVESREAGGPFADLYDFCRRVGGRRLNKRVLEALARAGALDCFAAGAETVDQVRARLLLELPDALAGAEQVAHNAAAGMQDLFGEVAPEPKPQAAQALEQRERLDGERDTLGLYLTGHPIDEYLAELRHFCPRSLADLQEGRGQVLLAGLVVNLRTMRSRRGGTMAFALLDDRSARIELSLFSDVFEQNRHKVFKDGLIVVRGDVQSDEYTGALKVRASEVFTIDEARARFARCLEVQLSGCDGRLAQRLHAVLAPHRGVAGAEAQVRVRLAYTAAGATGALNLPPEWSLQPSDELLSSLRSAFGRESASYRYEV